MDFAKTTNLISEISSLNIEISEIKDQMMILEPEGVNLSLLSKSIHLSLTNVDKMNIYTLIYNSLDERLTDKKTELLKTMDELSNIVKQDG